jgi:hypothetical protein
MCANPAPDDMWLTCQNFRSIFERCMAIWRPCHFKDTRRLPHTLDPQPWPESAMQAQIIHHLAHRGLETCFLVWRQTVPIPQEGIGTKEGGHRRLFLIEGCEKVFF